MARFYLLDHSLKTTGGHHLDYATRVARAASEAGFEIVIGANRRFHGQEAFPSNWRVERPFRYHMYSKFCAHNGWKLGAIGLDGELLTDEASSNHHNVDSTTRRADRRRRIRSFARALESIFASYPATVDDVVFLPSMTEFDVVSLCRFLRNTHCAIEAAFHVQVHFGMCEGREFEYERHLDVFGKVRRQLHHALQTLDGRRLFFYATTDPLARQFSRLGVRRFDPLPYPVHEVLQTFARGAETPGPAPIDHNRRALRIATPGAVRQEKGQQFLSDFVRDLWDDGFRDGRLQLAVQCKPTRIRKFPRRVVDLEDRDVHPNDRPPRFRRPLEDCDDRVIHCRHPLSETDYLDFIQRADIGLLMYDARRYYARHAGVLGEFLSAGVPVIVPAGCWLSDQLEPPIQQYRAALWRNTASGATSWRFVALSQTTAVASIWEATRTADAGAIQHLARITIDTECSITYDHLRIDATTLDGTGHPHETSSEIVSVNGVNELFILVDTPRAVETIRLKISYAFHDRPVQVENLELLGLSHRSKLPAGTIGLVAATPRQAPRLTREILRHYSHYRDSALTFAEQWAKNHHPSQTVARLVQQSCPHAQSQERRAIEKAA